MTLKSCQKLLDSLDQPGTQLSIGNYTFLLRWCGNAKALSEGKQIHAHIIRSPYKKDIFLRNLLIQMYSKCGNMKLASEAFAEMHEPNVYSWTIMIGAYAEHGQCENAFGIFKEMQLKGVMPNKVTCISILNACASQAALIEGQEIHAYIVSRHYASDITVANALLNMYGKCNSLEHAQNIFDKMSNRNVISWNTMIAVYMQNRHGKKAFEIFRRMTAEGVKPNKVTFVSILDACTTIVEGKRMHACINESGFGSDITVSNAIISMYGRCRSLQNACMMFNMMPEHNVVSWNAMIAAYVQHGQGNDALQLFRRMQLEDLSPNKVTFVSVFAACAIQADLAECKRMHAIAESFKVDCDIVVGNAIINMYGKCGNIDNARRMFDKMPRRNVVTWTAMISAYCQNGKGRQAIKFFHQMQLKGVNPNKVTFTSVLDACANREDLAEGKRVHAYIMRSGFESEIVVGNSLINMYSKCGSLEDAWNVFHKMTERDVISWTTIISAYVQKGQCTKALQLFQQMQMEGITPNEVTFLTILDACANQAALDEGKLVHTCILAHGFESVPVVLTALFNMYSKCGSLEDAWTLFDKMPKRNLVSWTAMIAAHAQHGKGKEALQLFHQLQLESIHPDKVTFVNILSACNHTGLVEEGKQCFVSMLQDHGIVPTIEHYNCIIDLVGREGRMDEVKDLIDNMPLQPSATSWITFLGACQKHSGMQQGHFAAEHVFDLE